MSTICREKANPSCFKMGINQSFSSTPMPQSLPIKRVPIVNAVLEVTKEKKISSERQKNVLTSSRLKGFFRWEFIFYFFVDLKTF